MPVDQPIRLYIDRELGGWSPGVDFDMQLEVIVTDIVALLATAPVNAQHTAAYLAYFISHNYMRSTNQTQQASYAEHFGLLFRRLYNDPAIIRALAGVPVAQGLALLQNFYHVHHALSMNGLRAEDGPLQLDFGDALRVLQMAVGAAYGPWLAYIRLQGAIRDYYHTCVRQTASSHIELGRPVARIATQRYQIATWNMQGGSALSEPKWRTHVLQLARQNDIVVLQEAGVSPGSAQFVGPVPVTDQFGVVYPVEQYLWQAGSSSRMEQYHLFFLDVRRHRVNLAIVVSDTNRFELLCPVIISDGLPDSNNAPTYRPALGVQVRSRAGGRTSEEVSIFNFHAIANGGSNASRMLREISWHTDTPFVLMGDFNRDPRPVQTPQSGRGNWVSPPDIARIIEAAGPTHPSTSPSNMLDYALCNGTLPPYAPGRVNVLGPSDHLAVAFEFHFP